MKILTNKKYKKLVKDLEELRNQCGIVADKCDMVANKLEVENTSAIPCDVFKERKEM